MVAHPAVRRVNFTGSTQVGRIIAQTCAEYLKPAVLELGGKAPLIVLDDADLDAAVNGAAFGAFANTGRSACRTERIIVDDEDRRRLRRQARRQGAVRLPLGDPRQGPVVLGSVIDMSTVERCNALIDDALAKGAKLVCGGKADTTLMPATVLDHVTADDAHLPRGNLRPGQVDRAREGRGRGGARRQRQRLRPVGGGLRRATSRARWQVARRIESGICHVNGPTVHDEAQMPFGGVKAAGYGRFGGKAGIDAFTDLRWITMQTSPRHYPF